MESGSKVVMEAGKQQRQTSAGSSQRTSIENLSVDDIIEAHDPESYQSVPAILHYCQSNILRPYLRLLSIVGLRPFSNDSDAPLWMDFFSIVYLIFVILVMLVGYMLQYMACFRRDRGFYYEVISIHYSDNSVNHYKQICHGSMIFSYIIPSALHLLAYLYAVSVLRSSEDEKVSTLMERVFLSSSNPSFGSILCQKRLVRMLWLFITLSVLWMITSLVSDNIFMAQGKINFRWLEDSTKDLTNVLKALLIICTLWHDIVLATIIAGYCLQAQLLNSYLYFLRDKLVQQSTPTLEWIREMEELKKLLSYINISLSPPVSILTIINMSWGASGVVWLLNFDTLDKEQTPITIINIVNVALWIIVALAPFIQAARLTNACYMIQSVGHEVRARPFVHKDTSISELDSLLLYISSLRLSATLFRVPITGKYLCLIITFGAVLLLTLGQCHYLQ